MLGSSQSIAGPNIITQYDCRRSARAIRKPPRKGDCFKQDVLTLVKDTVQQHKRIIFNGNNYSAEWEAEAQKRGLLNLKSTADCLPYFISEKNIDLFTRHHIFTKTEIFSRYEITLEGYCKTLNIEALTMLQMSKKSIIPAVSAYRELAESALAKSSSARTPVWKNSL